MNSINNIFFQFTYCLLIIMSNTQFVSAQTPRGDLNYPLDKDNIEKRIYNSAKIVGESPRIDGIIDDNAWNIVEWSGNFTQRYPTELIAPSYQTMIKIMYDDEFLYVGARMYDDEPDKILSQVTKRDNTTGDMITILIDSNLDQRTAFRFGVTVSGVKLDETYTGDGNGASDTSWDPVWDVKTSIDESGWVAEMKIPFSQLRYSDIEEQVWGINFWRRFHRNDEYDFWKALPQRIPGLISLSGELHGLKNLVNSRKIEMMPYTTGKFDSRKETSGDPFFDGSEFKNNLGFDAKVGLSSDFTLDLTVNPDFGQVEADASELNLTAFETFYAEKRPFFVEGKEIFESKISSATSLGGNNKLFHSRRIGSNPSYRPSINSGEFLSSPENTTILGAVKLSGKTKNGLSIGILESVTQNEKSKFYQNGNTSNVDSEPLTNYFVGSLFKDFDKGNTVVGGLITAVNRNIESAELDFLNTSAYSGNIDLQKFWKNKEYFFTASGIYSKINGSAAAIQRAQLSSARYFQRPDNDYENYNPEQTSMSGTGGGISFGRKPTGKWNYSTGMSWYSPGLELNDMGYLSKADDIQQFSLLRYEDVNPNSVYRNFTVIFNQQRNWNYGGDLTNARYNLDFRLLAKNFWNYRISTTMTNEFITPTLLRGGPGLKLPGRTSIYAKLGSNETKAYSLLITHYFSEANDDSEVYHSTTFNQKWRPKNNLSLSLDTEFTNIVRDFQYVNTLKVDGVNKYILGNIDSNNLTLTYRMNYSLSPTLSIEYYGQSYISAGKYSKFREVTDSRAKKYEDRFNRFNSENLSYNDNSNTYTVENNNGSSDYSFTNPDFNFRQFRSNLVLKWDFSPGSNLFLVWSQERTGWDKFGNFSFDRDINSLFNLYPDNILMLKINKWFSF